METLKERISREYLEAFKARETVKKNLLGVLKGEITKEEKVNNVDTSISDEGVSRIIKKFVKNINETLSQVENEEARLELSILELYLPKQMSESEIESEVVVVVSEVGATSPSDMGKVMTVFNAKHTGKADGKILSTIVKRILQK